jgi:hypothetical protein
MEIIYYSGGASANSSSKDILLPFTERGMSSFALRRSRIPGLTLRTTVQNRWSLFSASPPKKKKKKKSFQRRPRFGRPNVVVTYNPAGVQVRSLKNGRALCHLSSKKKRSMPMLITAVQSTIGCNQRSFRLSSRRIR